MVEDALKISFWGKITIFTSHQVKQLLNGKGHLWISDQRILSYQVMMMEYPGLTISPCEVLNPATLLPTPKGCLPFHSCLETLDHWTKPQEGLSEDPLTNPEEIWYTDRSSFVLDGKRRAGYAVVSNFETIEAKPLPPAVKVPGHDSWIHYSRVKPWKKTEKDSQYICESLGQLRYLFRTTKEWHSNKHPHNLVSGDRNSQDSSKESAQLGRDFTPRQAGNKSDPWIRRDLSHPGDVNLELVNAPTSPCYTVLMLLMILPCIINCLTCLSLLRSTSYNMPFQFNKDTKLQPTMENITHP